MGFVSFNDVNLSRSIKEVLYATSLAINYTEMLMNHGKRKHFQICAVSLGVDVLSLHHSFIILGLILSMEEMEFVDFVSGIVMMASM